MDFSKKKNLHKNAIQELSLFFDIVIGKTNEEKPSLKANEICNHFLSILKQEINYSSIYLVPEALLLFRRTDFVNLSYCIFNFWFH